MKVFLVALFLMCSVVLVFAGQQYIVKLKQNAQPLPTWTHVQPLTPELILTTKLTEKTLSAEQSKALETMSRYVVVTLDNDADAQSLLGNASVESMSLNRKIPLHENQLTNDSLSSEQYALSLVGAALAWKKATGDGIVVGIVDTGIDWEHEDLRDRLAMRGAEDVNGNGRFEPWSSGAEVNGVKGDLNGKDDDGNGYVDDVIGFDFIDQDVRNLGDDRVRDAIPFDEQGHGTSVASVICAHENNTKGIAGLAFDARVVSMRAFDATGNAEEDDIAAALIYAAVNGVDVVNMSFGDGVDSPALRDAIRLASAYGCVLVASAGNSGGVSRQFPASYDDVIAVAATNEFDERSAFSSTGSIVDLSAPGEVIITARAGGGYRRVNGTSFSAPYVAAAAAMLRQHYGKLNSNVVRSMLQESSLDLGDRGWDPLFGAGRLQVDIALDLPGQSLVEISSPRNEQEVLVESGTLDVIGSTQALMFSGYRVDIGKGAEPNTWTEIVLSNSAIANARLATIDVSALVTSDYVVRLVVMLKDGRTIEQRKRIRVLRDDTLRISDTEVINAWKNERKVAVLTLSTSRSTFLEVVANINNEHTDTVTVVKKFTGKHSIAFDPSPWGTSGIFLIRCTADNGDSVSTSVAFDIGDTAIPNTGATVVSTAPFAGYVLNDVRDVYASGTPTFMMNDLSSGGFGPMLSVQQAGANWGYQDSTLDVWIPRGMGDANGNGRLEVFAHVVGRAKLFEAQTPGGNPFATSIFLDDVGRNNAAGMADIDGDGSEELLMLCDSGCIVNTFRNGHFERLGIALNPTAPSPGNATNRVDEISVAAGDFDGDGNTEIAFSDTDGDLVISEYSNNTFTTEYVFEGSGAGGSGYVTHGDVDNDGKEDVLFGVPDSTEPNSDGEYGRQVWTYRLLRSHATDQYTIDWTEHIYGVRYGLGYRSGVEIGQIDNNAGNEIIICAFPRLFVFTWTNSRIRPLYYAADVVSPRFLTYDFNKNGRNELGFGKTDSDLGVMTAFQFIEIEDDATRIATPAGINAVSLDSTTARVAWMPVTGATAYRVFSARKEDGGLFRAIDTVATNHFIIDTLQSSEMYSFRVSALSTTLRESFRSSIATVHAGDQHKPISIDKDTLVRSELMTGVQFRIAYDGKLMSSNIEPSSFVLRDSLGGVLAIGRTATCATDTDVVVTCHAVRNVFTGTYCVLHVGSIFDAVGIPTLTSDFTIHLSKDTTVATLYLTRLDLVDQSKAHLAYSESVDGSALLIANYTLHPAGTIAGIERVNDSTVAISFGSDPPLAALGTHYSITVRDVTATSGVPITTGVGNTLSFVITTSDLDRVFVYPQPALLGSHEYITFANLTQQAEIEVLDQRFMTIVRIKEVDGNGGARWNMRDGAGEPVPPGMYFYRVTGMNESNTSAESGLRKFMIRR